MVRLALTRLSAFVLTLFAASVVLFVAINVIPGSAAQSALGLEATPQAIARFEASRGLDRPLIVQYFDWLGKAVNGDFGTSFQSAVPVGPELLKRLPVTLELALLAFAVANLIAFPLGTIAAARHRKGADRLFSTLASFLGAMPNFWLATLLVMVFSVWLRWLPPGGYVPITEDLGQNLKLMILPALSLGIVSSALLLRIMRASMLEVLSRDYIRTAKAKGASEKLTIWRHSLRNASIPYINVAAVELGFLFGSVVVIEDIFQLPGVGSLVLVGIINRDYPVLLASALAITVFVLLANLIVDICVGLLDPRRSKGSKA
ncbi:MAG: ABC transporter permease [Tabrizicola sp.]|nr:ABC transporter permease [Tabrizicola sp.]